MSQNLITSVVSILLAIIGVAIIAVILSNQAQTGKVLQASGNAFSSSLICALSPIIGGGNCGTSVTSGLVPVGTGLN